MRYPAMLALLLAAAALLFPSSNYIENVNTAGYIAPNGTAYALENFTLDYNTVFAAVAGGVPEAFFIPSSGINATADFLTATGDIEAALDSFYRARGHAPGNASSLAAVHDEIQSLSHAQDSGEAECRRLAGMDSYPCVSFDTCRLACFASPFCPNFIYGGAPGEFVYVLWAFENSSEQLRQAYADENDSFAALSADESPKNVRAYIESIGRINIAATKAEFSPLFNYSFCEKPDYPLSNLTMIQQAVQKEFADNSLFASIPEEAEKIRNGTLEGFALEKAAIIMEASLPKRALRILYNVSNRTSPPPGSNLSEYLGAALLNFSQDSPGIMSTASMQAKSKKNSSATAGTAAQDDTSLAIQMTALDAAGILALAVLAGAAHLMGAMKKKKKNRGSRGRAGGNHRSSLHE